MPAVEELREGEPEAVVLENARRKAAAGRAATEATAPVLGVDTDVELDGRLLGKPGDEQQARGHLEALSGRAHRVLSGVVVLDPAASDGERSTVAETVVTFRRLSGSAVDLYLASGEWEGRAGGYAIQGLGSILVRSIGGDFSNVVGLPVPSLLELVPSLLDDR